MRGREHLHVGEEFLGQLNKPPLPVRMKMRIDLVDHDDGMLVLGLFGLGVKVVQAQGQHAKPVED
jgi:hypothetical protein